MRAKHVSYGNGLVDVRNEHQRISFQLYDGPGYVPDRELNVIQRRTDGSLFNKEDTLPRLCMRQSAHCGQNVAIPTVEI